MILKIVFVVLGIIISFLGYSYIKDAKEMKEASFDDHEVSKYQGCGVAILIFAALMIIIGIVLPM